MESDAWEACDEIICREALGLDRGSQDQRQSRSAVLKRHEGKFCATRHMALNQLVSAIDADRQEGTNLPSAIRLYVCGH